MPHAFAMPVDLLSESRHKKHQNASVSMLGCISHHALAKSEITVKCTSSVAFAHPGGHLARSKMCKTVVCMAEHGRSRQDPPGILPAFARKARCCSPHMGRIFGKRGPEGEAESIKQS